MQSETVIISVGGSLIVREKINLEFLSSFKLFIENHIAKGFRFVIVVGGGKTARHYIDAANALEGLTREDLDWLGIHATRLNGHLLRTIFYKHAHPVVIKNPRRKVTATEPLVIAAGWKPGWSTDYCAVLMARTLGAKKLVNLSDIDYVYDKDPKQFGNAEPIYEISWKDFRKLIPKQWDPGIHTPFDPVASKEAQKLGLEIAMINGFHLNEFENYLRGEKFVGTIIK